MRLALADIKKTISRRGGVTRLTPYLLRPGELAREVEALIALYEAWVGRERSDFPSERAAELIGDYRLARCLTNCLVENYEWQAPQWLGSANDDDATALAERGIASPTHLRLALYDWVNDHAGGYLSATNRESALDACAASLGLRRATFDTLLALDGDTQAILRRLSDTPPTADELAQRYNQRAFEALLANAASVEWLVSADIGQAVGEPLGTVVKRLCFLARTMGVHYDLSFADDAEALPNMPDAPPLARVAEAGVPYETGAADDTTETLEAIGRPIRVLLYGPQEISAAPAAYGERLARLCRALLGYRRGPERSARRATLAGSGLQGVAQVYLHGRPLPLALDDKLLKLLGVEADGAAANAGVAESQASYDSALEARFASEFAALERAEAAHGWRLEREPEPLLVGETILVPDFALTRGMRRVYLEIAGYWRPGYRERKARKLTALRGRVTLAIAAPEAARGELGVFEGVFPLLWYTRDHIRAHELIALLDRTYDDSARRLATLNLPRIAAEVALRGRIPPRESYALLHSYTRAELDTALHALAGDNTGARTVPVWVDGLGLCDPAWLADLLARVRAAVVGATNGRMPLTQLASHLRKHEPTLAELDEATVESLAARAGLVVVRTSIFAADIVAPEVASATRANAESMASDNESQPQQPSRPIAQPRPRARRKQHRQNGQDAQGSELAQLNFFSPERADDEGTHED